MAEKHTPTVGILASGGGSTAEAFIHATQDGSVNAEVGLIVCSNPPEKAGIFDRVDNLNDQYGLSIEVLEISGKTHPGGNMGRGQTESESLAICREMRTRKIVHVALMGYMRMVRGELLMEYGLLPSHASPFEARMTNTHPGPLPETEDTYGIHTSERVLELGMSQSRHTVHLVSAGIDRGIKLAEHPVDVRNDDTAQSLFDRVQAIEKATLPKTIDTFLQEQDAYLRQKSASKS